MVEIPYIRCNDCTTQMVRILNDKSKSIQQLNKPVTKI